MNVYRTGLDLFAFGLSTPCRHECIVRLQRRQLVEHDREIAGAGDILLDNVVVNFESIWHTLTADPLWNVVFIEWNNSVQSYTKRGITAVCLMHMFITVKVGLKNKNKYSYTGKKTDKNITAAEMQLTTSLHQ